ncbi:MAG: thiamine-phosphate kinase [Planctomycetes bacterium]|nr:thiamine-phosphate kinase [Planctomycetota bacterium]
MQRSEFALINELKKIFQSAENVFLGPGDDCAVYRSGKSGKELITVDTILDGTHFDSNKHSPENIGYKAIASAVSDIYAMGGLPSVCVVSCILPQSISLEYVLEVARGMARAAELNAVPVVGGDVTTWNGQQAYSVTVTGYPILEEPIRRHTAQVGDTVFVTGSLGGSILGRHLNIASKRNFIIGLLEEVTPTSMIDISDGLLQDAAHLIENRDIGIEIIADKIPIDKDAATLGKTTGRNPIDHALGDGEDFELLFTVTPGEERKVELAKIDESIHLIGTIVDEPGIFIVSSGERKKVSPRGYDHFRQ